MAVNGGLGGRSIKDQTQERRWMSDPRRIAYFSMEIGLDPAMPTYSGGLGILAGDTLRSAADLHVPMVAVALLHRKGYFYQRLDPSGWQHEEPAAWPIDDFVEEVPERTTVAIEGRNLQIRAWKRDVVGHDGFRIPVFLLDSDLPENSDWDRTLTHFLYGGDAHYRLCQEVVLGIGGLRMLRTLGHHRIERFHMNEGHAAFLSVELLGERLREGNRGDIASEDVEAVRRQCVFTTHTPVPAGHDKFPIEAVQAVLGGSAVFARPDLYASDGSFNMTYVALNLSRFVNGVSQRHAEVASQMFPDHRIQAITNGVHAATWISPPFQELFDRHFASWRQDSLSLRSAEGLPQQEVWEAHRRAKERLLHFVNRTANAGMDADVFTVGFARRAAAYKRAGLLFHDFEWLRQIAAKAGAIQIIYAGKSHPHDQNGKELIQSIFRAREALREVVKVVYLENYDMEVARLITAGVDLWLNTPQPPLEASGTSGMKAALNGVPSLSVLDGWWVEGCIEGVTGWAIGADERQPSEPLDDSKDAAALYQKLENVIVPMYYHDREGFINVMTHAIALNGSFFNTQRMMQEYVLKAYFC
jgi:starch phosphorylase